ncbi:hypothetical protein K2X33_10115 [bacterium]|nr:hypothetical protein [bacterium]
MSIFSKLTITTLLLGQAAAMACDCAAPHKIPRAFYTADTVFVGRVYDVQVDNKRPFDGKVASINVTEAIYGTFEKKNEKIRTATSGAACGYGFQTGDDVLVYAYLDDKGQLATSSCSRSKDASSASSEIDKLRELAKEDRTPETQN